MVASAEVMDLRSNTRLSARTSEIAIGGCYVDVMNPFPEGTMVQVRILRDQGTFEAKAKVVYCDSTMGMGLAFTEMAPAHRTLLEDWLAEIVKPA
ncbi:MAG: PilZ domain-containing protein [Candidatus Acidiferrales bacterium]